MKEVRYVYVCVVFLAPIEKIDWGVTPPHHILWLTQPLSVYIVLCYGIYDDFTIFFFDGF